MATNSFLGSNSFIAPKRVSESTPYTKMDPRALGTLQPLVSDLIQTTAPKNKYLKETYSADPQALQNRLNEYKFYDPTQLEGLKDYFSPYAATTYKNSLVFKPSEFQSAQSKLFGLDSSQTQALSGALQAYQPIGTLGGSNYYSKDDIGKALSGYGAIDTGKWGGYSDSVRSKFSPVTTIGNQVLIRPEDSGTLRTVLGVEDYLSKLNPLRTKPLSYDQFWSEYGATPAGGWSDANTKNYNAVPKYLDGFQPNPEYSSEKPILQRWQDDTSYLPNFSLYGSGSPEDIQRGFNVLQRMSPQNIGEFWGLSPAAQKGMLENPGVALQQMRSLANPANGDWLSIGAEGGFRDINAYNWDAARGLTADRSQYMTIDDSNSGLFGSAFGFLDPILDKIDPLHNFAQNLVTKGLGFDSQEQAFSTIMPMVVDYFLPGVGSGLSAANAASVGNWGGALTGALGAYAGMAGAGLNMTGNAVLDQALTKAAISGAGTAASGGKMQDVLRNAALSGLASYGSGALGGAMKGASPLAKMAANTGYGTAVGGLSSALQGKGFSRGATNAARRGVTNAAINAALNSQLYKGLV